ncbi:flagellar basal body P-ring formation chaperone FlgA [Paraburkholderia denitrificans]|uniref:Flagellar basal body P-ring formation chaperone FlgA n=1 Tax=Paraburkholderia denitrificans TaxID=694025 RepID=A0ABW0J7S4_9BURK
MPQTAPARAPGHGAPRRVRSLRGLRFAVRLLALCCALAGGGGGAALAQTPGGQIYIAGPGDRGGADAAQMGAMLDAPGRGGAAFAAPAAAASVYAPAAARENATPPGMIAIPGPGERQAEQAPGVAPNIVTIPAPGTPATPAVAARRAVPPLPPLPRVSVGTASSRVAPVVVDASASEGAADTTANAAASATPGATHNPANGAAEINAANARANAIQRYAAAALAQKGANANANANTTANATATAVNNARSAPVPPGQEDGEVIRAAALKFLQQQSVGLPGRITVTVAPVFPRGLAACTQLEPFMPPGARTWGRTTVGVRCIGEKPWTLFVSARVAVAITYYTAARQIEPSQVLTVADLVPREGDLASLPRTVITDPSQATGALALLRISAGLPLRTDMLRSAQSVTIGQTVRVVAEGANFTISSEGSALNNAAPGQQVRVRTAGGQIITGVAKDAGTVQVQI